MKISNDVNLRHVKYNTAFGSERTDKKEVLKLKTGESTILENNKINILNSLNNLAATSDKTNIQFLLDVADNLNYGEFGNKKFKSIINKDGITPETRENTDWELILKDTIKRALSSSTEDLSELEQEYNRVFSEEKALTPEQKQLLKLRKDFTKSVTRKELLNTEDDIQKAANIRKNLDYFVASSEISMKEKQECLEKLIYFMSSKYKINPELKNSKLQVVDEILNDIIIKTPESSELKIKSVNQRVSGICASISICRKAMAYENKSGFIDLITEELKDSPVMSVYDITELGSGKKVEIQKTQVKYADALNKGYRIIDASAHIWMNNAHACGDGTIQTEHYIPFDEDTYGVFDDSSWYLGLSENFSDEKILLASLIKEKEYIDSIYATKKAKEKTKNGFSSVKAEANMLRANSFSSIKQELSSIFLDKSNSEITQIADSLTKLYKNKTNDNELIISEKMPDKLQEKVLSDYLHGLLQSKTENKNENIEEAAKKINKAINDYINAEEQITHLKRFNSIESKYRYNKKLYKAAAAHRLAVEADINLTDGIFRYEKYLGLPVRNRQIINSIKKNAGNNNINAEKDITYISTIIPVELDRTVNILTGQNIPILLAETANARIKQIQNNDINAINNTAIGLSIDTDDKNAIINQLAKMSDKLLSNPSQTDVFEAIRALGFENEINFTGIIVNSFFNTLQQGLQEEDYKRLAEEFGGEDKIEQGIVRTQNKFLKLVKNYNKIEKKWNVPSTRELILQNMEQKNSIISRKRLDSLKYHFENIENKEVKNEQILNSNDRKKANEKLYKFKNDHEETFNLIEKNLSAMKKYATMQYNLLNSGLYELLENQYSQIGMINGQFWVSEEGSSGLMSNEKNRIIEQMTGKPYHIEKDIEEAAKQIKKGNGNGVVSLSVADDEPAFHAMYIPAVTTEKFQNEDGKKEEKDIVWYDNTWGLAEKKHYWRGADGFNYTDYGKNYGWKNGFLLDKELKIGIPVNDIFGAKGTDNSDKEDFSLFTGVVMPGSSISVNQKIMKIFNYIFSINKVEDELLKLEKEIQNGAKIDINYLTQIDDIASSKTDELAKRIKKEIKSEEDFDKLPDNDPIKFEFEKIALFFSTPDKNLTEAIYGVNSEKELQEVYDEIVESQVDTIGLMFAKSDYCFDLLYLGSDKQINEVIKEIENKFNVKLSDKKKEKLFEYIFYNKKIEKEYDGRIDNMEKYLMKRIASASEKYFKNQDASIYFKNKTQEIVKNKIDEELRIKSLDSKIIKNNPLEEEFISCLDRDYNLTSDEDLLNLLQKMQNLTFDELNKYIDKLSDEDVGLNIKNPYDYVKLYLAGDERVTKAFYEIIATGEIYKFLPDESYKPKVLNRNNSEKNTKVVNEDTEDDYTANDLYRSINVKLSEMDVQKYVKQFKAEAFKKYKVRQAFPEPIIIEDDETENMMYNLLQEFEAAVKSINNNKELINFIYKFEQIDSVYLNDKQFKPLIDGKILNINDIDADYWKNFKSDLEELYEMSNSESNMEFLSQPIMSLINEINKNNSVIDCEKASNYIKEIDDSFEGFKAAGISVQGLKEVNNNEKLKIENTMHLLINTNVEPKYRNEAINILKNIINDYKKGADSNRIAEQENKLVSLVKEKHIIKNPTVLLQEYIKLVLAGKGNEEEALGLREYLLMSLKVAQQTKIQYKLVQNQHEAINSKIKDLLPLYVVKMPDGSSEPMSSDTGMLYLIEQLVNYNDNNVTLKLFLAQSGLSKHAVSVLIDNFDINKSKEVFNSEYNKIKKNIEYMNIIAEYADNFFKQSKIEYKSFNDAIKQFQSYMKRKLPDRENNNIYNNFIAYFDYILKNNSSFNSNYDIFGTVLNEIYLDALQEGAETINGQINGLNEFGKFISDRKNLVNSIDIPSSCEENKKRENFNEGINEIYALLKDIELGINSEMKNCKAFTLLQEN